MGRQWRKEYNGEDGPVYRMKLKLEVESRTKMRKMAQAKAQLAILLQWTDVMHQSRASDKGRRQNTLHYGVPLR